MENDREDIGTTHKQGGKGRVREWKLEDWRDDSVDLLAAELEFKFPAAMEGGILDMAAHTSNPNTGEGEMGDPVALAEQTILPNSEIQFQGKILSQNTKLREIDEDFQHWSLTSMHISTHVRMHKHVHMCACTNMHTYICISVYIHKPKSWRSAELAYFS